MPVKTRSRPKPRSTSYRPPATGRPRRRPASRSGRSLPIDRRFLRIWGGLHLMLLFALGLLGFFRPEWSVGDVPFADVSAGGNAGLLLAGSALGILAWVAASLTGLGLLWPPGARASGRAGMAVLRWLVSLDIPERAGDALRSLFTG